VFEIPTRRVSPSPATAPNAPTVSASGTDRSSTCAQYMSTWSVPNRCRLPVNADRITGADSPSIDSSPRAGSVGWPPTFVLIDTRSRMPGRAASHLPITRSLCPPSPDGSSQNA
jgi:hypothetical protein